MASSRERQLWPIVSLLGYHQLDKRNLVNLAPLAGNNDFLASPARDSLALGQVHESEPNQVFVQSTTTTSAR